MKIRLYLLSLLALCGSTVVSADVLDDATTPEDNGWRRSERFGWYYDFGNDWISHQQFGLVLNRDAGDQASYLWKPGQGWWYAAKWSYPFAYSFRYDQWFSVSSGNTLKTWYWMNGWERWLNETQLENLAYLQDLLEDFRDASEVTWEMRLELRRALRAFAGSIDLSDEALDAYAATLAEVWSDQSLSDAEREQLLLATNDLIGTATYDADALEDLQEAALAIIDASNLDVTNLQAAKDAIQAIIDAFKTYWASSDRDNNGETANVA
ncbi:MAG: hypothetical protein E1N59_2550 [Puniceicoccaceae bacterium 5H]|nr:MAG: hypothetical protein E1N59_2550 [Puniceicoccaceae bacterium 5H]